MARVDVIAMFRRAWAASVGGVAPRDDVDVADYAGRGEGFAGDVDDYLPGRE